jgi:hypothetical protein
LPCRDECSLIQSGSVSAKLDEVLLGGVSQ